MGSGSRGASSGSHRCSFSTANAYSAALGKRADISEPRWNVQLSQPPSATIRTGRPAHCGNWSATSRRTSSASTVMRRGGAPSCGVLLNETSIFRDFSCPKASTALPCSATSLLNLISIQQVVHLAFSRGCIHTLHRFMVITTQTWQLPSVNNHYLCRTIAHLKAARSGTTARVSGR